MEARRKRSYASCTPRETIRQEESCQLEVVAEAGAGVDWGDGRDMALGRIPRTAEIEKTGEIQLPTELIAETWLRGKEKGKFLASLTEEWLLD